MRSSVASRNQIEPTQPRPFERGEAFNARGHSACYDTSVDQATIAVASGSPYVPRDGGQSAAPGGLLVYEGVREDKPSPEVPPPRATSKSPSHGPGSLILSSSSEND